MKKYLEIGLATLVLFGIAYNEFYRQPGTEYPFWANGMCYVMEGGTLQAYVSHKLECVPD